MSKRRQTSARQTQSLQQCAICGAVQPLSAIECSICGATLPGEPKPVAADAGEGPPPDKPVERRPRYDPAIGDDDLFVGDLTGRAWRLILIGGIVLALGLGLILGVGLTQMRNSDGDATPDVRSETIGTVPPTSPPTATPRDFAPSPTATATERPLIALATVTPMPPTPTDTPTPGPCIQVAQAGDTVYGMAIRCGHRDMAVIDAILELNDMASANELQVNQELQIPWPTPTPGAAPPEAQSAAPVAAADEQSDAPDVLGGPGDAAGAAATEVPVNEFGTPDALAAYRDMEPTLRPGLAWHTVVAGEDIITIAFAYGTNVEVLSQINPEVAFLQCDYGYDTGGPNCSVMIYEGQRLRVPVPLPSPTPTLTPVGTLTPTPSPTPTFNAPYSMSPPDGQHFFADERVTLRWGETGVLGKDERYVVRVHDLETGEDYFVLVDSTRYELPGGWQPDDGKKHEFEWTVSVGVVDADLNILGEAHTTDKQRFTWDSR